MRYFRTGLFFLLSTWCALSGAGFTEAQLEWLESDIDQPAPAVNEGKLKFITTPAEKLEHQQSMKITLTEQTIPTGWAVVSQCHENLDKVDKLEIVFHADRVKNLEVTEYKNIQKAWSEGHRVVVRHITEGSRICLRAESRIFHPVVSTQGHKEFEMVNGPFMRRFLDGFYPLTLALEVNYPEEKLRLVDLLPTQQSGWKVRYDTNRVFLQGRFEGMLLTRLRFSLIE